MRAQRRLVLPLSAARGGLRQGRFPTLLRRSGAIAAKGLGGAGDEMVTVFRGVHAEHPQLANAFQGKAVPMEDTIIPSFTTWATTAVSSHLGRRTMAPPLICDRERA
jgi:hypothetical protein